MAEEITSRITEDWYKDEEKRILTKKYSEASTALAGFFTNPSIATLKFAYALVMDYIQNIPIGNKQDIKDKRKAWQDSLDEINLVIYGNTGNEKVRELFKKYNINLVPVRSGIRVVYVHDNLMEVGVSLRRILTEAGDTAMEAGLRMLLPKDRKFGLKRLLEEEGFENLEV